jgi:undecaprenyl pyrophosphate phosphatase UppP
MPAVVGAAAAFAVGLVALKVLRRMVMRGHFAWFAAWVLPMAALTLWLGLR